MYRPRLRFGRARKLRLAPPVRFPRGFSMKRMGLIVMVSFSLYSLVALANQSAEAANVEGEDGQPEYLRQVEVQLERLEGYLDKLRQEGVAYESIENFMTVDDVELLLKDVRGDLSRLQEIRDTSRIQGVESAIDRKLTDIQQSLTAVEKAPAVIVVNQN